MNKIILVFLSSLPIACSAAAAPLPPYVKGQIASTRFGDEKRQKMFEATKLIRAAINERVIGQQAIALAIETRMNLYLNSVGSRGQEPVALHLVGLPGVGKSSITEALRDLGFPVIRLDAQKYDGEDNSAEFYLAMDLHNALQKKTRPDAPLILFIDELDKVPELRDGKEVNQPIVAALNQILSEGRMRDRMSPGQDLVFSNIFVLTAMNFAPDQIDQFTDQIFKEKKSFWDFDLDDMKKFDDWIRGEATGPGASAKIMGKLFRSNTVSRIIPDVMVARSLDRGDYDEIVHRNLEDVIERLSRDDATRVKIGYRSAFLNFLRRVAVYPPSGARMTVKKVDLLTEQLISIALRDDLGLPKSLILPREIVLDFAPAKNEAVVRVRAVKRAGVDKKTVATRTIRVRYESGAGTFAMPPEVQKSLPNSVAHLAETYEVKKAQRRLTRAEIGRARAGVFKEDSLEKHLNSVIFDQEEMIADLSSSLGFYLNSVEPAVRFQTLMGFTGVGKTAAVLAAAKFLDIPVVKMNLQEYSNEEGAAAFGADLATRIEKALEGNPHGKLIVLFEELDKAYEVDPKTGAYVTRTVFSYIKDLLNEGHRTVEIKTQFGTQTKKIDLRNFFTVLTLNFPTEQFGLTADPRVTTIEDMQAIHRKISSSVEMKRKILTSMFLPETVNRIISDNLSVPRPLTYAGYEKLVAAQFNEALKEINSMPENPKHRGAVRVTHTPAYLHDYLMAEAVIPSEGGRNAERTARSRIAKDLVQALRALPAHSPLRERPVLVEMDFEAPSPANPGRIRTRVIDAKNPATGTDWVMHERALRFPTAKVFGSMSAKRLLIASHEFGHAWAMIMHGARFESAMAVSSQAGIGGMVKTVDHDNRTGRVLLAELLGLLGARAMERVLLAPEPRSPAAVSYVTDGASADIAMETKMIWSIVHTLGMAPAQGLIDRGGLGGPERKDFDERRYFFEGLPQDQVRRLGLILRDLETYVTKKFLESHPTEWYVEKIARFAREGVMNEKEFYELLDIPAPQAGRDFLGGRISIFERFKEFVEEDDPNAKVRDYRHGQNKKTAAESVDDALEYFHDLVKKYLGGCEAELS